MTKPHPLIAALFVLALLLAACGGDDDPSELGGGDELSLAIESPSDGAQVAVPFTLRFASGAALGPPDSGDHHIHVFYDGNEDDYVVVEEDSFDVTDLTAGQHTISASLRNADHSAAGPTDEITVTVTSGGSGETGGGGYDY